MKLLQLSYSLILILLFSCNKKAENKFDKVLNQNSLEVQNFSINIERDTTLITKNGCVIKIPSGSLEGDTKLIKLNLQEAISLKDILLGGLNTKSGNNSLSSAGMININVAEGYKATIKKSIEILVPSRTYNPDMQVYKGKENEKGKIDWQNPTALTEDVTTKSISAGELIFKASCTNCHKIDMDYTGPSMLGVTYLRPKKWLYDFTRNPEKMIYTDCNSKELFYKWKPTVMTAFPNLSDEALDSLYGYIKAETDKRGLGTFRYEKSCCDSCFDYKNAIKKRTEIRDSLIEENEDFFNLDRTVTVPFNSQVTSFPTDDKELKNYITPTSVKATYYTINIEAFGWYNIDAMMKGNDNCKESELFVKVIGEEVDYNVSLIIPTMKVFVEGGRLDNKPQYGFYETNGKIPLPQNIQCFVVAFAQYKDQFLFGQASFNASTNQTIVINTKIISKEEMLKAFSSLDLTDVRMKIKDSKNSEQIKKTDNQTDSINKLKPKNCDCGFSPSSTQPMPNTTAFYR